MLSLSYTQIWVQWERSPGLDSSSFEEEKINFNVLGWNWKDKRIYLKNAFLFLIFFLPQSEIKFFTFFSFLVLS